MHYSTRCGGSQKHAVYTGRRQQEGKRMSVSVFSAQTFLQGHGLPWWCKWPRICLPVQEMEKTRFDPWVGKISWRRKGQTSISCLENSMDRGAWRATVHGIAKRGRWNLEFTPQFPFRLSTCLLVLKIWTPVPLVWLWLFRENKIIMKVIARGEIF